MKKMERAQEIIKNGKVVFDRHHKYFNDITNKEMDEHLRHIEYKGATWFVDMINDKYLQELFIINK